jgi:hypothetical protein
MMIYQVKLVFVISAKERIIYSFLSYLKMVFFSNIN